MSKGKIYRTEIIVSNISEEAVKGLQEANEMSKGYMADDNHSTISDANYERETNAIAYGTGYLEAMRTSLKEQLEHAGVEAEFSSISMEMIEKSTYQYFYYKLPNGKHVLYMTVTYEDNDEEV